MSPPDAPIGAAPPVDARLSWPVGTVGMRLGIAAPTLRSWDRRYGVGPGLRTTGNHRRYTADDVRRVHSVARMIDAGVSAQTAAAVVLAMSSTQLHDSAGAVDGVDGWPLLSGWEVTGARRTPGQEATQDPVAMTDAICAAVVGLEAVTLTQLYRDVLRRWPAGQAWEQVLTPALRRIGELWAAGEVGVEGEHLSSEILSAELRALTHAVRRPDGHPVLLSAADEEQHHLPVLALQAELARLGRASTFLGGRLPPDALGRAIALSDTRVAFVWASMPRPARDPLWAQLSTARAPVSVVVGGPGWPGVVPPATELVTVTRVDTFEAAVWAISAASSGAAADG